jgi:hypothetical protein
MWRMVDAFMYVLDKIYIEREGSERCLKSWMLGNTECVDQNFRGGLCSYIFIGFRIIVCNGGPFLRGQRGMVD